MYSFSQIAKGIKHPNLGVLELNRIFHTRLTTRPYNTNGVNFFDEDWDNLLILDACRYDTFKENHDLPGKLESKVSRGSQTGEFLKANFDGRTLTDTVYVTSNPWLSHDRSVGKIETETHATINVWEEDGWDDEVGTVLPETMNTYALQAAKDYPDKRLVVHYVQPHHPFINSDTEFDKVPPGAPDKPVLFWKRIMTGDINIGDKQLWDAYVDNLQCVLPYVERLMKELPGKTVVTADHGNLIGDRINPIPIKGYGHPGGLYVPQLVNVPWLEYENGDRKQITDEPPVERDGSVDDSVIEDRLRNLGYKS